MQSSDFLTNKRMRLNVENNNNLSIFCNEKLSIDSQIEFNSKNVVSSSKLFDKELAKSNGVANDNGKKRNRKTLDHFFTTVSNSANIPNNNVSNNNISSNNDSKISSYFVYIRVILGSYKSNLC